MLERKLALPGSSVTMSRLGFGCSRLFGAGELSHAAKLVETAFGAGVRHFDTAPSYGNGTSEAALGACLAGVRDVTIATKVGIPRPDTNAVDTRKQVFYRRYLRPVLSRFPLLKSRVSRYRSWRSAIVGANVVSPQRILYPSEVVQELERSLKLLRRDYVDLYLIHEPDNVVMPDETRELFQDLMRRGAIRAYGMAYGGPVVGHDKFGAVIQQQFTEQTPGVSGDVVRIFHGVLKSRQARQSASSRINKVLGAYPNSAVLFSASTPWQIRDIARTVSG